MSLLNRLASLTPAVPPGAALAGTVTLPASLGFVPVAVHFDLFGALVRHGSPATAEDIARVVNSAARTGGDDVLHISTLLVADTLYIMAGLGLVNRLDEDRFVANAITHHMVAMPSAQHGAVHFCTEGLLAGAFLMQKLKDTNFAYPFAECDGPLQYAYRLMGQDHFAKQHTYTIMEAQGRMDSFNQFMVGKFFKVGTFPDRVTAAGYDLEAALGISGSSAGDQGLHGDEVAMVDIGGGRGELLLEVQARYPNLQPSQLVVQEFNAAIDEVPGVHLMEWNYKVSGEQPVRGARAYSLQHILHNLPDLDAVALVQKLARAMSPKSRLLIIEYAKNLTYTNLHASMIALYGGRERSSAEWHQMAGICGLKVTFEKYETAGESLVEMQRD
ncbi:hypothetical protein N7539_004435 [Penicillium diatomitis]|uniref:O-methyltransferase C-terminal domain-containing protein n=1 Tax=Penicillium diatomitis TaxID=2819901 RepID=A0A9W9XDU1_9EURO|nr:uncharacterized protein N7539_004435 [Penicillium diatomitis]KAJ5489545.1 hypothetical protein N7539_004435 [Penicillium diatomitis]